MNSHVKGMGGSFCRKESSAWLNERTEKKSNKLLEKKQSKEGKEYTNEKKRRKKRTNEWAISKEMN